MLFSILIISKGREDLLMKCLESVKPPEIEWQLIPLKENPSEMLLEAEGEWVLILREDATLSKKYWDIVIPLLLESKLEVLGGPDRPHLEAPAIPRSFGIALSSPFCSGMSFARYRSLGNKLTQGDEEKLGEGALWVRREYLSRLLPHHELLQSLNSEGRSIFYHPRLISFRAYESTLGKIAKASFHRGRERSRLNLLKLSGGGEAFWLPSIFVFLHLLLLVDGEAFQSFVKLYWGIILFVSLGLSLQAMKFWLFPLVALIHYFVVIFYGIGFLYQRIKK
jgi:hypothetical protein